LKRQLEADFMASYFVQIHVAHSDMDFVAGS